MTQTLPFSLTSRMVFSSRSLDPRARRQVTDRDRSAPNPGFSALAIDAHPNSRGRIIEILDLMAGAPGHRPHETEVSPLIRLQGLGVRRKDVLSRGVQRPGEIPPMTPAVGQGVDPNILDRAIPPPQVPPPTRGFKALAFVLPEHAAVGLWGGQMFRRRLNRLHQARDDHSQEPARPREPAQIAEIEYVRAEKFWSIYKP